MDPLVSIVVPSFNDERYIRTTLDSLLAQTYRNIEVVVIDDESTDATPQIVRSYGDAVRLIAQRNTGVSKARNHGAAKARGDFVCFCDHDDYWYPEKVERQVATFAGNPSLGVVYTEFIRWAPDARGVFAEPLAIDRGRDDTGTDPELSGWIYHKLLLDSWVLTSTAMIRRAVLDECGAFDESLPYGEDWELFLRISRSYPFAKLKSALVLYRQHNDQGSRRLRSIDYRTKILSETVARWGLASPDGRSITRRQFRANISRYHLSYGLGALRANQIRTSWRSFLKGWLAHPSSTRPIAYLVLSMLGWRPRA
jgi:glycosyltransferase involved in cell wall biosynthesis